MKETKFYSDKEKLKEIIRDATERETKIIGLTNENIDRIGRGRGESDEIRKINNMRSYGSVNTGQRFPDATIGLAAGGVQRSSEIQLGTPRKARQVRKEKSFEIKKAIVAGAIALSLAGGLGYVNFVNKSNEEGFERATEIVSVVDAGNYHPQLEGYDLIERANGDFAFRDANGETFGAVGKDDNIISAEEIGNMISEINVSHQK